MAQGLQHIIGSAVVLLAAVGSALPHPWRHFRAKWGPYLLLPSLIWRSDILQRDVISEEAHRLVAALQHHHRQALDRCTGTYN